MSLIQRLEKRFSWFAVPNLSLHLVLGQLVVYVLLHSTNSLEGAGQIVGNLELVPALVVRGEIWRLVTFLFIPPITNAIFFFFGCYIFYLMGTALEGHWGSARYTWFLFIGYLATVIAAFLTPAADASNAFLAATVFLAFAHLNPDFVINIFFVLPVKIKWLALLTWLGYGYRFLVGSMADRFLIVAAVANFLLFFGREIIGTMRSQKWRMERRFDQIAKSTTARHQCTVCGATERSAPEKEFRYCTKCKGTLCYCLDHLKDHVHTV